MIRTTLFTALALTTVAGPGVAVAQHVVSDDRLSLPDGPGSLEGLGDNVSVDTNMGLMSWSVPVSVPSGFASMTPEVDLHYSSAAGNSEVGIGWSLRAMYVERLTLRGVPRFDAEDEFTNASGDQLVYVGGDEPATYRSRFESGFVRYRWHGRGAGAEGYWTAEMPDGRVAYFGARADGTLVPNARMPGRTGVFRYHVVEIVDPFGHRIRYDWEKDGIVPLCTGLAYVFDGPAPRYRVALDYEDRPDHLSSCLSGRCEILTQRLARIDVSSRGERIRRYELTYDDSGASGGVSRLVRIAQLGLRDEPYPARFEFTYSKSLGGDCDGTDCVQPYLVSMGSLGLDISAGNAGLVDMTGDGLPDVVNSGLDGPHRIHVNVLAPDGTQRFDAPRQSTVEASQSMRFSSTFVQILDANGDGFADVVDAINGVILTNRGSGDWDAAQSIDVSAFPDFGEDENLRFLDWNNDKRIDVIRSESLTTQLYENVGEGVLAPVTSGVEPIGAGFVEHGLRLEDMNGDGLLDAVVVAEGTITRRLNLGNGAWGPWVEMPGVPAGLPREIHLVDLNGDGPVDLVLVRGRSVQYALNRAGAFFDSVVQIDRARGDVLPENTSDVTVLFADMNGSGSEDIVWIDRSGSVTYLELFPVRPNLLERIENGLGMVTVVRYTTSAEQLARDGAWRYRVPHSMIVVAEVDTWDELTDVHEVKRYAYHDGFYDGVEKRFRGYAHVEQTLVGDEGIEPGSVEIRYDLGATDPYRAGLEVERKTYSAERLLNTVVSEYEDCDVGGVPESGLRFEVRHMCLTLERSVLQEGKLEAEWVTTETRYAYDDYGNPTLTARLGVTAVGGRGCGACDGEATGTPCGAECAGDEIYEATEYVSPSAARGRWILGRPFREVSYGRPGDPLRTETTTYYDGEAFEGLPEGTLERGLVSRVTQAVTSDRRIPTTRNRHDAHGNVVETLDPLAALEGEDHRRRYTYDDSGLRLTAVEIALDDYALRREVAYEPVFDKAAESTSWMIREAGVDVTARNSSYYGYDAFGRIAFIVRAGGDTIEAPTEVYTYELASPVSRIVSRQRSQVGGPLDLESVRCVDGRGRTTQTRTRIASERYLVSGFTERNVRGADRRVYQPYESDTGECAASQPDEVEFVAHRYDATGREVEAMHPDGATTRSAYGPLVVHAYDEEDTRSEGPHFDTPFVTHQNGLGWILAYERRLADEARTTRLGYDGLGRLVRVEDAAGHVKRQTFDLLGRVLTVDDPNAGLITFEHDDGNNVVGYVDARGVEVRSEFDGANRPIERYETGHRDATSIRHVYDRDPACADCTNAEGRLARAVYPAGHDEYGYDVRGRTVVRARSVDGFDFRLAYGFDNADRRTSIRYPDGRTRTHRYDDASRPIGIDDIVADVRYDDRGQLFELAYADGTRMTRGYDVRRRVSSVRSEGPSGRRWLDFTLGRDDAGNILTIADAATHREASIAGDVAVEHDSWYRPRVVRRGAEVVERAFDHLDNVMSQTGRGAMSYGADRPNAVSSMGGDGFAYDDAGRMITRGSQTLTWDFMGRLVAVDGPGASRFSYGADASRVAKRDAEGVTYYVTEDFEVRDGIGVLFDRLSDGRVAREDSEAMAPRMFTDVDSDGRIDIADAWLGRAERHGEEILRSAARRLTVDEAPTFLHVDHRGSIVLATRNGEAVMQRDFDAYGADRGTFGEALRYGFTGQERDTTGLDHFENRYYDSALGRWLSPDPAYEVLTPETVGELGQSTVGYAYVANHAFDSIDPTGLTEIALGRNADIKNFAKQVGARYWQEWTKDPLLQVSSVANPVAFQTAFKNATERATLIHFNLVNVEVSEASRAMRIEDPGGGQSWYSVRRGNQGWRPDGTLSVSAWELKQIIQDPSLLSKTVFYGEGGKVRSRQEVAHEFGGEFKPAPKSSPPRRGAETSRRRASKSRSPSRSRR